MRLAIDCRMYGKSGIGRFLAGVLPFLCAEGVFDSVLLLAGESPDKDLDELAGDGTKRIEKVQCGVKPFSLQELLFFPKKTLARINSCDCYFSPYCNVPSGIRVPVYTTIHDLVFLDFPGLAGRAGVLARKFFYKYAVFRSEAVFTVSEFSRGRIQKLLSCRKPVYVACNGIPRFMDEARKKGLLGGQGKKKDFVIFIGNIKAHKGLKTLMEAFAPFRAKTGARLVIVGSGENFRTKDKDVERMLEAGTDGIEFTGRVSDERLVDLLSSARILVQPSLYEGFGIPPMEALFCGTRAVVSDIPAFKEVYGDFPVSFFRAGDAADLLLKMDESWHDSRPIPPLPERYSYWKAASVLLEHLKD